MIFGFISILFLNIFNSSSGSLIAYSINDKSSLTLSGSSNINKFECVTFDNFSNGSIFVENDLNNQSLRFSNALLRLKIKSFDCRNPLLSRDFYNTLQANKNPYIEVELLNVISDSKNRIINSNSGKIKANVAITLNGKCRFDEITVSWHKNDENTIRFIGTKQLLMSDFGIQAPVAAMGLIKVHNEILIHFDLYIQAEPKVI
ncbi:MAG: YceI family protein [Bacteroidales bacterium]|nr:MAG: YceI family protein [Bacteroidales bacterium]